MNAPFGWPTKSTLPLFRFRHVAVGSLGFLAVSCSENLAAPGTPPVAPRAGEPAVAADIIIMERTTTDAADAGRAAVVHASRQVLTPQLQIARGEMGIRSSVSSPPPSFDGLPRPPLALPARRETAMCSELPTWTQRTTGADGRDLILTGHGDAPASSIKVMQGDGSVWNVERSWTRTATTWQLDRQVTTGARGYRDVVTYRHQTPSGRLANNALPRIACTTPARLAGMPSNAISKGLYAPHAGALNTILFPGTDGASLSCGSGVGEDCYTKQITLYKDDIAIVVTATTVALACSPPAVLTAVPCIAATAAYLAAVANLALDKLAYQHCLEQQSKPTPVALVSPGATNGIGAGPGSGAARTSISLTGATGSVLGDCGAIQGTICHWDVWEISYDGGVTWEYFDTFLVCDAGL